MKKEKLIKLLNQMISLSKPIKYKDFNVLIPTIDKEKLRNAEKENKEIGIAKYGEKEEGISTLSVIATITDVLVGERLAFSLKDGFITGVEWYCPNKKQKDKSFEKKN